LIVGWQLVKGYVHNKTDAGIVISMIAVDTSTRPYAKVPGPVLSSESSDLPEDPFANIADLTMRGICQTAEMLQRGENQCVPSDSAAIADRFSAGDVVRALVISVDVHSEKIYLSLNQNRMRGLKSQARLGLVARASSVSPSAYPLAREQYTGPKGEVHSSPSPSSANQWGYGSMEATSSPYSVLNHYQKNYFFGAGTALSYRRERVRDRTEFCGEVRKSVLFNNPNVIILAHSLAPHTFD